VQRHLAIDPASASRAGGPLTWEPILYLAYSRLPGHDRHAAQIARLLLDHGASANSRWVDDWQNPFSLITGVIALGEGVKPPHPQADALVDLFIDRGADPYDTQSLYNTSIVGDDTHWLEVLWTACAAQGATGKWLAVPPTSSTGKKPLNQLDYLLGNAVAHGHLQRAAWLLDHGASANCMHSYSGRPLLEIALLHGQEDLSELLRRHGALDQPMSPEAAMQVACLQGDHEQARTIAAEHPEVLAHANLLKVAAALNRTDMIGFLLHLGMPVDIMDEGGSRALQAAVAADAREAVRMLLERGSEVDTPTKHYGGAMGTAAHFGRRECAGILAPLSRDVHAMTRLAMKQALTELFNAEPGLVNQKHFRFGLAPLFMLPDEEESALEMARFLLAHGADMLARDREGLTAGALARRRGQDKLATLLGS
jgi:ankyrin repeat protein